MLRNTIVAILSIAMAFGAMAAPIAAPVSAPSTIEADGMLKRDGSSSGPYQSAY